MKLTCEQADKLLSAYVDGELPREEARALALHLAFCQGCLEEVRDLERAKLVLVAEAKPPMPETLAAEVEAAVLAAPPMPRQFPRKSFAVGAGVALAAVLVIFGVYHSVPEDRVPVDVFLAEHTRALSKTAVQRRTALVAAPFYTENAEN